jgi:hypothetical protein
VRCRRYTRPGPRGNTTDGQDRTCRPAQALHKLGREEPDAACARMHEDHGALLAAYPAQIDEAVPCSQALLARGRGIVGIVHGVQLCAVYHSRVHRYLGKERRALIVGPVIRDPADVLNT